MRTTLFFTAALAAISFSFQANATPLQNTGIEQYTTELSQVDVASSASVYAEVGKDKLPADMK